MKLFKRKEKKLGRRGGWSRIFEAFSGAWQTNTVCSESDISTNWAIFSCATLIAQDISKLPVTVTRRDSDGIYRDVSKRNKTLELLKEPNSYQTTSQFVEFWILCKLYTGNTYAYLDRDRLGDVRSIHILNPDNITVLQTNNGDVFYQLTGGYLADMFPSAVQVDGSIVIPARNIVHDRFNTINHPLIGLSPIVASALASEQGIKLQKDSIQSSSGSMPAGILEFPGSLDDEIGEEVRRAWNEGFKGKGKYGIGVLSDGGQFKPTNAQGRDTQLVEQLKWSASVICATFHVPPYKIGLVPNPGYNTIDAQNTEYHNQALHKLITDFETSLGAKLNLESNVSVSINTIELLRMDRMSKMEYLAKGVQSALLSPDEGRLELNRPPVEGGGTPYLQQQNWALSDLSRRSEIDIKQLSSQMLKEAL